jgi:hypothetical protein
LGLTHEYAENPRGGHAKFQKELTRASPGTRAYTGAIVDDGAAKAALAWTSAFVSVNPLAQRKEAQAAAADWDAAPFHTQAPWIPNH